ncbi:mercury resistance system transport protein MerF [Nisaea sp.]|uniref:mercury resistance system transport protein MerF n=1 Tax=Nisaea sp. TaxID=2024842 RepID=UPI003B52600D
MKIGIAGMVVTAICCLTPVLVILAGAIGLSWITGYLDLVLVPALGVFVFLIGIGLWRKRPLKSF